MNRLIPNYLLLSVYGFHSTICSRHTLVLKHQGCQVVIRSMLRKKAYLSGHVMRSCWVRRRLKKCMRGKGCHQSLEPNTALATTDGIMRW